MLKADQDNGRHSPRHRDAAYRHPAGGVGPTGSATAPALDWVLDQYKEKTPKDPTIREKFNTYRFADYKEKVDRPARPRGAGQRGDGGDHRGDEGGEEIAPPYLSPCGGESDFNILAGSEAKAKCLKSQVRG